jgi:hypothetical protein
MFKIKPMQSQTNWGGARPNSGPKPNIERNMTVYKIALWLDVGLGRARRIWSDADWDAESLIGKKQFRILREIAASEDALLALDVLKSAYIKRRKKLGFKP